MKHWSFLFSYLVAPKGAVCLFVCFSSKAMEFFFIIAFTEEFLPLFGSNPIVVDITIETRKLSIFICCAVFLACKRIRFLVTAIGEPTLSVFLDPFDDFFLELRPLALPATICTFGFRQRLYVVNLPSPVLD